MRLDPPFDSRYLRYLWMLKLLEEEFAIRVINRPTGILIHNEKLFTLTRKEGIPTFVGTALEDFLSFCASMKSDGVSELILKPVDLYQGMGVEKISLHENQQLKEVFSLKIEKLKGPLLAQPFLTSIYKGEVRSIYFRGKELGSIVKIPPKGDFLANVARGASFKHCELTKNQREQCEEIVKELACDGIEWVAFDLIGDHVSEVNITCPGLLVETAKAMKENLALGLAQELIKNFYT